MSNSRVEYIFKRYSAALKGFVSKQLSSDQESEDMLHDVFYRFIVSDGEHRAIENVSSWLYRVARNMIIDRSRKHKESAMPYLCQGEDSELAELALSDLLSDEYDTPETELLRTIIRDELAQALLELPTEQRVVFELNELEGIPFSEISESTGIPINTLISRKRYAVQYLRSRLDYIYQELGN